MTRARFAPLYGALLGLCVVGGAAVAVPVQEPFPHEDHAGLFPLCTGCHAGAEGPEGTAFFPEPESCATCHDGVELDTVVWEGPSARPGNLVFDHGRHARSVDESPDPALACTDCHGDVAAEVPMEHVGRAPAEGCLTCHAHQVDDHYVQGDCAVCHAPVASAGVPGVKAAAFPTPADHEAEDFLAAAHGDAAQPEPGRCAVCHVQDQCTGCHVAGREQPVIASMPPAPAHLDLPRIEPRYPTPVSHLAVTFDEQHDAGAPAECTTCHTRSDCTTCHVGPPVEAVESMPEPARQIAPGVGLERTPPTSHDNAFWERIHGMRAAADGASCATCHLEQPECIDCHDGPTGSTFHPDRYMLGHAADAAIQDAECATCHSTEVFCRDCHISSGFGSVGRLGQGYHDAQPVWLLQHGQAARQQLETCTSCHQQRDCTQCHSQTGTFRVSPHRSGFDAARAAARNPAVCRACHIGDPIG